MDWIAWSLFAFAAVMIFLAIILLIPGPIWPFKKGKQAPEPFVIPDMPFKIFENEEDKAWWAEFATKPLVDSENIILASNDELSVEQNSPKAESAYPASKPPGKATTVKKVTFDHGGPFKEVNLLMPKDSLLNRTVFQKCLFEQYPILQDYEFTGHYETGNQTIDIQYAPKTELSGVVVQVTVQWPNHPKDTKEIRDRLMKYNITPEFAPAKYFKD